MSYNSIIDLNRSKFDGDGNLIKAVIEDGVTCIGCGTFSGCTKLTSITIPDSVTSIGDYAFDGCIGLTSITIPDSVTSIGEWAFYDCTGLTSITIPDSVISIGCFAFFDCSSLKYYGNRYFKITNTDMSCRNRHYRMNKWYYLKGKIELCHSGFHACRRPTDCFNYYYGDVNKLRFFEVKLGDIIDEDYSTLKVVSNKIKFIKEYSFKEFIELANNAEKRL